MPRRLRIEYPDAIYHVMSRGNARRDIVLDDDDRRRILAGLGHVVGRADSNLARGMQAFLSAYAQWWWRRRRRLGHLSRGRYRAEMIEDESYYWTVSRYIHLNPVRAGLVPRPEA